MTTDQQLDVLIAQYAPSQHTIEVVTRAQLVLLVGITGAGKNTLKQELLNDDSFYDFVSYTTRPPRSNLGVMERDGVDYFFIDRKQAVRMLETGAFVEAKKVHSNIYGTATDGLMPSLEQGRVAVNDVDVQGTDEYKRITKSVHAVFVLPPSYEEWERRRLLRYSGDIDPVDNQIRLDSARLELDFALNKGYFDFVINDDVHTAANNVRHIIAGSHNPTDKASAEALARSIRDQIGTH